MQLARRAILTFLIVLFSAPVLLAADLNFPYMSVTMSAPPSEDPIPGLGTYYSTIAKGMKSALWNPAGLGKLKLAEVSLSAPLATDSYEYQRSFNIEETGGELEFDPGSIGGGGNYGLFFRYPQDIGPGLATREIEVMGHAIYATDTTGINFSTAQKVNEWVTVGFAANNPFEINSTLSGAFPVTAKATTSFYGQDIGDMEIGLDGKLRYTYTDGPVPVTYESTAAVWNGFLSQEATLPVITFSELRNDMSFNSPYTGTIASHYGDLYVGLNMVPISATANIDNDMRALVDADTQDIYLYTPNFDPNDPNDINQWSLDPNRYGSANGFQRKDILLPAGDVVATAKYKGFYSASTTRFDLGGMYDVTDWLTVGLVLENIGGSTLNFHGTGRSAFVSYRKTNTEEADSFDELLQPGGKNVVDLISDQWITSFEVNGRELYLEEEKNIALPRRIRYGIAFKKPFLILIDFEQNQNTISIDTVENDQAKTYNISNISFLRIGTETQLLMFPMWLRGGLTLMAKPTVTGLEPDAQESFDNAFQFGYLPVRFDMGSDINFWGTFVGGSFGINGQSVFNFAQADATNPDMSKILFWTGYVARDAWTVTYRAVFDPAATAAAYGSKTVPAGTEKSFEVSDVRLIQTLGVTYRF